MKRKEIMMKNIFAVLILGALLCATSIAQDIPQSSPKQTPPQSAPSTGQAPSDEAPGQPSAQTTATQSQGANTLKIAPGSVIPVQLAKTVDAKKAKTGDEVMAKVTQDMKANSGEVLVPKDTQVIGHVTEAQARNKEQKQSQLGIAFDRAVVKGDPMQLPMSIQAVIAPPSNNPNSQGANDQAGAGMPATGPSNGQPASGRAGNMGGTAPQAQPQQNAPQASAPDTTTQSNSQPEITGKTEGVIGMPDVKLETSSQNGGQGSLLSSEKNNVKIEKGTMMLLRVNR